MNRTNVINYLFFVFQSMNFILDIQKGAGTAEEFEKYRQVRQIEITL